MKIVVVGNGYIGQCYAKYGGYDVISSDQFRFDGKNFDELCKHISKYDVVINAVAKTDTRWTERRENFHDLWLTNVVFVGLLSEWCNKNSKKFVHLSTIDLYGNQHDITKTIEDQRDLDLRTEYRLSKYASERMCHDDDLILRIRLPFDDTPHPKNLLVKLQKFNKFYRLASGYTYTKDLVKVTKILLESKENGVFNIESSTSCSVFYIAKDLLDLPATNGMDMNSDNVIGEFDQSGIAVFNVANIDKVTQYYEMTDLDSSIISCYCNLRN